MKNIFYEDRIIPAYSIKCIEINSDIHGKNFSITVRQVGDNYKLFSSTDKELVDTIFKKLKEQCDGIDFIDLVEGSKKELEIKRNIKEDKPKTRKRKVSDRSDRKE